MPVGDELLVEAAGEQGGGGVDAAERVAQLLLLAHEVDAHLHPPGEVLLLLAGEERDAADLAQVHPHGVVGADAGEVRVGDLDGDGLAGLRVRDGGAVEDADALIAEIGDQLIRRLDALLGRRHDGEDVVVGRVALLAEALDLLVRDQRLHLAVAGQVVRQSSSPYRLRRDPAALPPAGRAVGRILRFGRRSSSIVNRGGGSAISARLCMSGVGAFRVDRLSRCGVSKV